MRRGRLNSSAIFRMGVAAATALTALAMASPALAAGSTPPAGGAAIGQVIIATAGGIVATAILLGLVFGHRSGKVKVIQRLVKFSERVSGAPNWSAIPLAILGGTLAIAVYGMYWDISIHLDKGRDPGPLANAAHYFILLGLFGVLFAGVVAMALPLEKPSKSAIHLPNGWWAPLGGVIITVCGSISLLAFPLDDIWHRIFGQDVTLWGPTHLLLFGGAAFSVVGALILQREGKAASMKPAPRADKPILIARFQEPLLFGSFLVGLSTFQGEFDFAVPQFRLVFHPMLLMLAAGVALVAARLRLGRGGALAAAGVFIVIRGLICLVVGPIIGHTTPYFPLYLAEAAMVELVALRMSRDRPITFGVVSGAAIGTVGLAAEWGWSHVAWTIPWPSSLFPEGAIVGFIAAIAGGVLGGYVGRSLDGQPVRERFTRVAVPAAAFAVMALTAYGLQMPTPAKPPTATVALQTVKPGPKREVQAVVRLHPPGAAHNAHWFNATAWQGGGSVVTPLKPIGPGLYRTTKPIPVYGKWKVTLRLQRGNQVLGLPVYFPSDPAIPAPEIPAAAQFTRAFKQDKKNLQREQKAGTSGVLVAGAYTFVLLVGLSMFALLAWGLNRLSQTLRKREEPLAPAAPTAGDAPRTPTPA
ncbi:MAG: hypothetical protein QOK25_438 [Thermoleophilaceae bacterium]|nr:hypothetical protein [Thermoleophilaceae bacterium]